jgi:RimJ/RimL family protein N-acetyltransferase
MKLIPVDPANEDHVRILYECFLNRPDTARVSSKGRKPTFDEHREFVANHPYADWCLIERYSGGGFTVPPVIIGAIGLTPPPRPSVHGNEIGVDILPLFRGQRYADKAIQLMMDKHDPGVYMAHVARDNYTSMALFKRLGFEQVQVTFTVEV